LALLQKDFLRTVSNSRRTSKKYQHFIDIYKKKSARYATALHLQPFKRQGVDREKKITSNPSIYERVLRVSKKYICPRSENERSGWRSRI
jgi:hypothetical protein